MNSGWFSSINEQLNQIKDVMTNQQTYDSEENEDDLDSVGRTSSNMILDEDDLDQKVAMLRAEVNKYKFEIGEMEKKLLESEQRETSISKEFKIILLEKEDEIKSLKETNEHLKSTLISPPSTSPLSSTTTVSSIDNKQQPQQEDSTSLGITLENDISNSLVLDDSLVHDHTNQQQQQQQQNNELLQVKTKEEFQQQISTIQTLHQEKLYNILKQNEEFKQEIENLNQILEQRSIEKGQQSTIIDNLQKQIETLNLDIKNLNQTIIDSSKTTETTTTTTTTTTEEENNQTQNQNTETLNELNTLKEQYNKANKELIRLRQYLMDVEEQHTSTDLENEEKIVKLEQELKLALEQKSNSKQVNEQMERLKLELVEKEEEIKRTNICLNNLNNVLEQFQADQEATIQTEMINVNQKLEQSMIELESLRKDKQEFLILQRKFSDSEQTINRLHLEIESKNKEIIKLREDIEPLKVAFDKNILRLSDMCLQEQESVNKRVVSKLFLTYFKGNKKNEVLELIAKILNFSEKEKLSIGLTKKQWSLIPFFGSGGNNTDGNGESEEKPLTDMWIEFLLKEAGEQNNNNSNNESNHQTPTSTPVSTPTKQQPLSSSQSQIQPPSTPVAPPPSPSTPFKPINNNYFSVTPNHNGKFKSTVIYDGDMSNNSPFK
eukprot:gene9123-11179_t